MDDTLNISDTISLVAITLDDADALLNLMHTIYVPPYKHLWQDDGDWYVQNTFNSDVLKEELADNNKDYYFIVYKNESVGILRLLHDVPLKDFENIKATKLHRIYLDPKVHGKGIGKIMMDWTSQEAIKNNSQLIWLEAMDTQQQALAFYEKLGYQISSDFRLTFDLMYEHLRGMHRMYKLLP